MDRSVDSIGSCSLDVDADSSEMSDCSSIFLTPLSTKDLTREFTSQIQDRCPIKLNAVKNSIVTIDNENCAQAKTNLTQPAFIDSELPVVPVLTSQGKKPSYLNLACCVNGYSSITTYDSKIRQDINKSREVSPIRPSTTGIQYCKNINTISLPLQVDMPNQNNSNDELSTNPKKYHVVGMKYIETNSNSNRNGHDNVHKNLLSSTSNNSESGKNSSSFIQQRVERLYGPGALAQGFYSPKKVKTTSEDNTKVMDVSELSLKLKQISPNKDFKDNRKSIFTSGSRANPVQVLNNDNKHKNSAVDLPVLRHLSQEFRAQLPSISPKRNYIRNANFGCTEQSINAERKVVSNDNCLSSTLTQQPYIVIDEVDFKGHHNNSISVDILHNASTSDTMSSETISKDYISSEIQEELEDKFNEIDKSIGEKKDGSYFLKLLKIEQERLLVLAERSEKYIDILSTNPEICEDILGILRSASGKARLLVSQKLKQFEGLCQNNLNRASEDKFPTTMEDLQGFWDMVNLQIDNVDSIFKEIDLLKQNDWKKTVDELTPSVTQKQQVLKKNGNMKLKTITNIGDNNLKTKSVSSVAALKREAQRKQLLELKRKHKISMSASSDAHLTDDIKCTSFKTPDRLQTENCS